VLQFVAHKVMYVGCDFGAKQSMQFDAKVISLLFISLITMCHHSDKMEDV
jgi:hypothetical protein